MLRRYIKLTWFKSVSTITFLIVSSLNFFMLYRKPVLSFEIMQLQFFFTCVYIFSLLANNSQKENKKEEDENG